MSYRDQGNDLRFGGGPLGREVVGPLGLTAAKTGSTVTYVTRDPDGNILSVRRGGTRYNYAIEPNGNVTWIMNPSGTVLAGYKYSPYGKTTVLGTDPIAAANKFRWLASLQNTTSGGADGHYKLGARYYDSQGHFTQPDPVAGGLEDPRTLTSYNYAGGDPINQSDPSGYCWTGFGWYCDGMAAFEQMGYMNSNVSFTCSASYLGLFIATGEVAVEVFSAGSATPALAGVNYALAAYGVVSSC